MPPQKIFSPGAVKTITLASVERASALKVAVNSRIATESSALTGGRSRVTVAMRSRISTRTWRNSGRLAGIFMGGILR
ncbi:hypothetical protein D3C80_2078070 [compost metagenome]